MSVYIKPKSRQDNDNTTLKVAGMSFILRWWNNAVRSWQRRKMIAALADLDDRILMDIGLCRGEIEDFVDGLSSGELRMAPISPELVRITQDLSYADLRRAA